MGQGRPAEKTHITGVCTIFADGSTMRPLFIMPRKKKLDEEQEGIDAFFSMTEPGWMNKNTFIVYCILFITEIQSRRVQMSDCDVNVPFLLIVDGHSSHLSYLALRRLG
ncbi:hypothetical protein TVAG_075140 [Trichomonas vaginalis G3]|uniref:DDE-1 domain-containing protein n=1 Tax=Trichomonas vaginalis (strain ATCC PRA-98 / G3) TaxID=412133 RepID=A2G125_TRIV3|nr:DDE endonuclease family [Trichomonas vaginalis G3]EAX89145.1 hypothetical protein TVAG_075140 [Trichomonas vaginalis G3]KAI5544402.1 DDE endonuclease family [Trichomonas vaginalis G3]|eukprot:XP_001302075.1 hypothetical protein [Trichomonas vaginalis G3]